MLFDSHIHTKFSADSEMTATEVLSRAGSLNLGVVFTEHYDFGVVNDDGEFTFDPAAYMSEYKNFRGTNCLLGVEVGLRRLARAANKNFLAQADFDFVIGSIHLVDDLDLYYPEFYADKDKPTAYRKYFAQMLDEVTTCDFDALGHIDYICRAAPYDNPEIDYATFHAEIDAVLKVLVAREKILELNTRRFNNPQAIRELVPVYKKYRALGGQFVTLGSDAHKVGAIGNYFDRALEFVRELDLSPVTFRQRRMEIIGKSCS
ncbi:MAG: histidinol-phosphatase HisJ family protein [Selenomonadaceae bacterium]|nr:histidinol-phosphatase HisJ family protein [Selenomonadaceae bacterium]